MDLQVELLPLTPAIHDFSNALETVTKLIDPQYTVSMEKIKQDLGCNCLTFYLC